MKVHILTNALDFGDAVSTHCILLKESAELLGIEAYIHAEFSHDLVAAHVTPLSELKKATAEDILLHQLFNDTSLMPWVEQFPGRRVLMYHNITPPEYFPEGSETYSSCSRGLRLVRSLANIYDLAVGMSEFSRLDLERMGFPRTGVFPLLMDLARVSSLFPNREILAKREAGTTLIFIGRVAPNKRIEDLLRLLAEYRKSDPRARLLLVGNDAQHPDYVAALFELAKTLPVRIGQDVVFTGKVPDADMLAYARTADAFVCMSEHEGFCAPLIECMALGIPVFAYAGGAVEETLGGAGAVFPEKNFSKIAQEIKRILGDRAEKDRLLANQFARVREFNGPAITQRLKSLLDRVLAEPLPPARGKPVAVTVVINTFNRGWHLERCLESLDRQEFKNFEVVVVNGPSTDDTAERLARFGNRIRVVMTQSRVLSVSRNLGIAGARGELVAFLDDDAVAEHDWLTNLVPAFEDPSVGGAGGMVYRMSGRDIEFRNGIINRLGIVRWNEADPGTHWNWEEGWLNTVSGNNCIFRRETLQKVGGFDERIEYYHDEADVVMKIAHAGFRTLHRPAAIVYHEAAKSHNRHAKFALNWFAITKNTLYCALKNYSGTDSRLLTAGRIAAEVVKVRMRPIGEWRRAGEIDFLSWLSMEWACVRGIGAGLYLGLLGGSRPGEIPQRTGEIAPYATMQRDGLSVGLISQTLPAQSPGGIATYTMCLARALRDLGCSVHIISAGDGWTSRLDEGIWFHTAIPVSIANNLAGIEYSTLRKNLSHGNGVRLMATHVAAKWGLDLIESPNWDSEGVLTAMEHRLPVVVRVHSPLFKVMQTQEWPETDDLLACCDLEGLLLKHADAITGSTKAILELVYGRYTLPKEKAALIPLGLASDPEDAAPRQPAEGCTVLFVGRLERRKGIHTLIAAIPEILRRAPATRFEIVGRDEQEGHHPRSWSQRWRHDHPLLYERVRFHGEVEDAKLHEFYRDCDIFVAPSLYESFGLVYLEAMARGKAVVGTKTGGIPEVVAHGETGILVPPDDVAALVTAILTLIEDGPLRLRLGSEGRTRFHNVFSAQALGRNTLACYQAVAKRWASRSSVAWRGRALDSYRPPSTQIVWAPENGSVCLLAAAGPARTIWYGPYIALDSGSYRAEFTGWISQNTVLPNHTWIFTLDVFNVDTGFMVEKRILKGDLFCEGWSFDVFFSVENSARGSFEFRVHTSGATDLYMREVNVRRYGPQEAGGEGRWPWETDLPEQLAVPTEPEDSHAL